MRPQCAAMLIGLAFRVLREPFRKAFVNLPQFSATKSLPADINGVRFSLMRALQAVRAATLQQFGGDGPFEHYMVGYSALPPVMGKALIAHGWVTVARPHWIEAIVQYRLSDAGLALEYELEAWWAALTLGQRLRAALLE